MMGLTEGMGHLFYDGMPFLMFIILTVGDTQIGNVSVTIVHRDEMCQILIGNCGRFIFCSQNFILMERKKREIILCIQNPLCIKIMCL